MKELDAGAAVVIVFIVCVAAILIADIIANAGCVTP